MQSWLESAVSCKAGGILNGRTRSGGLEGKTGPHLLAGGTLKRQAVNSKTRFWITRLLYSK